eukprot:SAG11_NODE_512_length_8839_cov_5.600572_10_plen_153_part_00
MCTHSCAATPAQVYDVDEMLEGRLGKIPFPFIGADVPEGHCGQCVEGMSHGSCISKIKFGFHLRRLPWGFNADHQPVGGKWDIREDALVRGALLSSYITYDVSHQVRARTCTSRKVSSLPSLHTAARRARHTLTLHGALACGFHVASWWWRR